MAKESAIEITDSDSSIGSNGYNHVQTVTVPSAGAPLETKGSSAPSAIHKSSKELAQTSKKQMSPQVAPPPSSPPRKRSKKTTATVITSPPPPKPIETETVIPIEQKKESLRMNNSNAKLSPNLSATLAATLIGEHRLNQPVGVTYSRPYGGGSRPSPLVGRTSPNPNGGGSGAPNPVGVTYPQPRHPRVANLSPWRYHTYMGQNSGMLTADFLSQMETGSSAPVQVQRENPSNEMLAAWGQTLTLGNGRGRRVDLNLRMRLG